MDDVVVIHRTDFFMIKLGVGEVVDYLRHWTASEGSDEWVRKCAAIAQLSAITEVLRQLGAPGGTDGGGVEAEG